MNISAFEPVGVTILPPSIRNKPVLRIVKNSSITEFDEPTFAKLTASNFQNGTIEVNVLSKFTKDAPDFARGFIGIAFRINADNSKFECIYIRPANARVDDQVRRNHTIQYFSYPNFKFDRLRKEAPEKYESYTDMALEEWIHLKIVVKGSHAALFVNNAPHPALIVNDLKHGPDASGAIGLWVDAGTDGTFSNLIVHNDAPPP